MLTIEMIYIYFVYIYVYIKKGFGVGGVGGYVDHSGVLHGFLVRKPK